MSLSSLPYDVFRHFIEHLSFNEIINLCQSNKELNAMICDNQLFWHNLFTKSYGPINYNGDWRMLYSTWDNLFFKGQHSEKSL